MIGALRVKEDGSNMTSYFTAAVKSVEAVPVTVATGGAGAIPGLTAEETAILAGVLIGLATFLFLLLPILCCLLPVPCLCGACGKKRAAAIAAGKQRHANITRKG